MEEEIEIPAVDIVLADQLCGVALVDGRLQPFTLANELTADIYVASVRAHSEGRDQAAFDQVMRIVAHDLPVLARTGFGFVGIDDEIVRTILHFLRHEGPFETRRETRAAATAQAGLLHDVANRFGTLFQDLLGAVPETARHRALQAPVLQPKNIREDTVAVGKHQVVPDDLV